MGVRDVIESLLVERAAFSTPQVASAAGVSRQAAHKHLKLLVKQGVLEVQGKARAARYHGRIVNRVAVGDSLRVPVDGGARRSRRRAAVRRTRGVEGAPLEAPVAHATAPRLPAESVRRAAEAAAAWRARVELEEAPTQRTLEMATLRARLGMAVEEVPTRRTRELAALRAWLESSADVEADACPSLAASAPLAVQQVDDWELAAAGGPTPSDAEPPEATAVDDSQTMQASEQMGAETVAAVAHPTGPTEVAEASALLSPARAAAAPGAPRPRRAQRKPATLPAWLRACTLGFKVLAQALPAAPRATPQLELPPLKARAPGPSSAFPVAPGVVVRDATALTVSPTHGRSAPPLAAAPESSSGAQLLAVGTAAEPPEPAAVASAVPGSPDVATVLAADTQLVFPVDTKASDAPPVDDSPRAPASTAVPTAGADAHEPEGPASSLRSTWVRAGVDDTATAAAAALSDAAPGKPPQAPGPERVTLSVQSAGAEFRLSARILLCDVTATELVIDFAGIEDVGDEFLEEVLVRYAESHPTVHFEIVNAAAAVRAAVATLLSQGVSPAALTIRG